MKNFVSIKGSKIHYLDAGVGDPILFLHGVPASSYVWRHIFPEAMKMGRCIAPDLIGMGESEKPAIGYRIFDHIAYIDAFIEALELKNITLVLHGWGSLIGFDYARRHPENVKAIAFYEAHIQPVTDWSQLSLPVQQLATLLKRPDASFRAIMEQNYFIEKLLPRSIIHSLSEEEMNHYRAPFTTPESRQPLWQYLQDLPLGKGPEDVVSLIRDYSQWLQETQIPKLMLYAVPGFITTIENVRWARDHFPNITLAPIENALHFAQESAPSAFSAALTEWRSAL